MLSHSISKGPVVPAICTLFSSTSIMGLSSYSSPRVLYFLRGLISKVGSNSFFFSAQAAIPCFSMYLDSRIACSALLNTSFIVLFFLRAFSVSSVSISLAMVSQTILSCSSFSFFFVSSTSLRGSNPNGIYPPIPD